MKLISPTKKVKTFKSWDLLKKWLEQDFDEYDEKILDIPFKSTVYWDLCPFAQDIYNGQEHFVWNADKDELEKYLRIIAQEI